MIISWIKAKITLYIVNTVIENITVGAHCGTCGKWVAPCLGVVEERWTLCDECLDR